MTASPDLQTIATALADHLVSLMTAVVTAQAQDTDDNAGCVPAPEPDDVFWTVDEVARLTKHKPSTIREKARTGKIPARKLDAKWLFIPDEIRAWAASLPSNTPSLTLPPGPADGEPSLAVSSEPAAGGFGVSRPATARADRLRADDWSACGARTTEGAGIEVE